MRGELVRLQLYDLGGTLDLAHLERSLTRRQPKPGLAVRKGTPGYVEFPRPLVLALPKLAVRGPIGAQEAAVTVSYFAIGAASFQLRVLFETRLAAELARHNELQFEVDGQWWTAEEACRRLLEKERQAWESAIRDRYTRTVLDEWYTVIACHDVGAPADQFFEERKADIAAIVKGEPEGGLHEKEIKEATRTWFSYYADDVIVIDWDVAFLVDPSPEYDDVIFVLEIANLQLLQFRAYDKYLDGALQRAYDELGRVYKRAIFSRARRTAHDLSLLRMEIAELADEADNITKFLGDWFLARIYGAAQDRFHLPQWRASVDEKLATLNQLYQIALGESDSRRNLVLEFLIVLLFILDVILLFIL